MISFSGQAAPSNLFARVSHHATGIQHLIAPIAVVLLDALGRSDDLHDVRVGSGWNSVNLYLASGERIALRARKTGPHYDHLRVFQGGFRPLGELVMEIRTSNDVARFHRLLRDCTT